MSKSLPPLNWFRAFEAAARRLSFTAAGEEIGMTQSAVSQQIRALETRLGTTLFIRQARGLALTDAGRNLLPQVEAALETLARATGRFEIGEHDEQLTIAASISMIDWVIVPALPAFQADHPDLAIRFISAVWSDEFAVTHADVQIRFGSAKQAGPGARQLLPNRLVALKSPDLAGGIGELPLIETIGTTGGWAAWGRSAGISGLRPSLFADSYGLALRMAKQGLGIALASSILVGRELANGDLLQAHDVTIEGKEGYFLRHNDTTSSARAFVDWLHAQLSPSEAG
ncbi:LysR family transcriptional regulator [Roseibium salinum]|uniref:LysR family transcriptional regulator n=1 Tax=Roseibium salinum TaxID=1604349 RepID=A0ABT3QWG5_9HYPH|nr:LysR family transcriptional regulator [Roseibium sp. DSM 29163]MCX2721278.1 LysR family transcriptional regulator [Roseibium sp. DSM 29163]